MVTEGVDYGFQPPTIASLVNAQMRFACRYVGPGSSGKHLTYNEAQKLTNVGIAIVANAEGTADGLLGGAAIGRSWATSAHAMAVDCGMPSDKPIYLSADFDVQIDQWPLVRNALRGAGEVLGPERVGVYGGHRAISLASRDGVADWFWQTYAWSRWRDDDGVVRTHWFAGNHIEQYNNGIHLGGGVVDYDRSKKQDFGQWGVTEEEEEEMADVYYKIQSSDKDWNGQVFVSNRIHRRKLRNPGNIQGPACVGATEVILTDAMRLDVSTTTTWDDYLNAVAGPLFPALGDGADHVHAVGPFTVTGTTGPPKT